MGEIVNKSTLSGTFYRAGKISMNSLKIFQLNEITNGRISEQHYKTF